jgi:hypothetical protein
MATMAAFQGRRHVASGSHGPATPLTARRHRARHAARPPNAPTKPPPLLSAGLPGTLPSGRGRRVKPRLAKAAGALPVAAGAASVGSESRRKRKSATTSLCCKSMRFWCASLVCCRWVR